MEDQREKEVIQSRKSVVSEWLHDGTMESPTQQNSGTLPGRLLKKSLVLEISLN